MHCQQHPTHAPSVAYDRVTWDGKGTVLRWDEGRSRPAPEFGTLRLPQSGEDEPPPF